MNQTINAIKIKLWGSPIGAASLSPNSDYINFQYTPEFTNSNIEVSPIKMPLSRGTFVWNFPHLAPMTFHGMPGLLADSLPDKYGNALINTWLALQGRPADSFNAIERLCYTGTRGMGALEFEPHTGPNTEPSHNIQITALVSLASEILTARQNFNTTLSPETENLQEILSVGTSAGGARAKAIIAWNPLTNEVRSGQTHQPHPFEHWIIKFDGVSNNKDKEEADPKSYTSLEYAYSLMAKAAKIQMTDCRIYPENENQHFMTKRFDRLPDGSKLHMQSLGAIAHYDFNRAREHSYEQAFLTIQQLQLGTSALEEQYRRMVFNILARNQDDHVKNIAFLMDKSGTWKLSPAYDLTYSYNPNGKWTSQHQMTINGKADHFTLEDLKAISKVARLPRGRYKDILQEVSDAIQQWPRFAAKANLPQNWTDKIATDFRRIL